MQLRPLVPEDISILATMWAADMGPEWPLSPKVAEQRIFCTRHYTSRDACIAFQGDTPTGICVLRTCQEPLDSSGLMDGQGYIHMLIGTDMQAKLQLLDWAEDELRARGVKVITFGKDPFHTFAGVPDDRPELIEALTSRHYEFSGASYDLHRDLSGYSVPDRVEQTLASRPDVQIAPLQPDQLEAMLNFFDREFPGRWKYEAICRLQAEGNGEGILVAQIGNTIEGFCQIYNASAKAIGPSQIWAGTRAAEFGGLGAIGCSKAVRGQGIGFALLCLGVAKLQEQGITEMCIDWTSLLDFYGKIGFKPWKKYLGAVRRLD